jgi:threonine dehydrogenase-like Zn-dependent dehydrogenase
MKGTVLNGLVLCQEIDPSPLFDLMFLLSEVAEGYKTIDEHRAIKALLQP